jgi:hypothetical protein
LYVRFVSGICPLHGSAFAVLHAYWGSNQEQSSAAGWFEIVDETVSTMRRFGTSYGPLSPIEQYIVAIGSNAVGADFHFHQRFVCRYCNRGENTEDHSKVGTKNYHQIELIIPVFDGVPESEEWVASVDYGNQNYDTLLHNFLDILGFDCGLCATCRDGDVEDTKQRATFTCNRVGQWHR